jgi:hypothetical protein
MIFHWDANLNISDETANAYADNTENGVLILNLN